MKYPWVVTSYEQLPDRWNKLAELYKKNFPEVQDAYLRCASELRSLIKMSKIDLTKTLIKGELNTRRVWINNEWLPPYDSQQIRNHSPDGFCWGYGGSGPAQLALAILYAITGDREKSLRYYQDFKWDFVAKWQGDFEVEIDIKGWLEKYKEI